MTDTLIPPVDVPEPAEPTLLAGRYELIAVLGRGGMADVWRGFDHTLHRPVAVKVLRNPADTTHRARFIAEARTLAGLNHRHIVSLLDAGLSDGDERPYLVMDLVEGQTLRSISDAGPLAPARVAVIGQQLAEALCHAHAAGVVHRDVKPSNILITADGNAHLADFGIARLIGATDQHTRTDETVGSPAYLSPEQVTGTAVTRAIDIYSLGLVLLETLTGRRAYAGTPVEAAIARLQTAPLIPTSLGPVWVSLLERMTRLDPAERPSAAAVAATLVTLAEGPTVPTLVAPQPDPLDATGAFVLDVEDSPTTHLATTGAPKSTLRRRAGLAAIGVAAAAAVTAFALSLTGPAPTAEADLPTTGVAIPHWTTLVFDLLEPPVAESVPAKTVAAKTTAPVRKASAPAKPKAKAAPAKSKTSSHTGPGSGHGKPKRK